MLLRSFFILISYFPCNLYKVHYYIPSPYHIAEDYKIVSDHLTAKLRIFLKLCGLLVHN